MNKKILISLSTIGLVSVLVIGGTIAYFNDTETSTGNILVAGEMDLKVDHIKQTYNGIDCRTCSVLLISDPTNTVVKKNDSPVPPYNAVYVSNPHPRWTAQNHPQLAAAGAEWIWEHDPTRPEDTIQDVTYTFQKKFDWWGPITGSDLWMAVGSDNSVKVYLNGTKIGQNDGEYGYEQEHMLEIPAANITNNVVQGENILEFQVKNWGDPDSTPESNPAGLIYKFSIDGLCEGDFFKEHCSLWGEKDLEDEKFFNLEDVKPGDHGKNIISLHIYNNPAWGCLVFHEKLDDDNGLVDPEEEAGDSTGGSGEGELSQFVEVTGWMDENGNGNHDLGEDILFDDDLADGQVNLPVAEPGLAVEPLDATTTYYIGLAWCVGDQTVNPDTGEILCDGSSAGDIAQTDSLEASLSVFAEQFRNNLNFSCSQVVIE